MANWTDIPDSVLEPAKPIRAVDGIAFRDNPIAIAQGAPGAPRIENPAYAENSIDFTKLNAGPLFGAATRSFSIAFNLTFGEGSGTSFAEGTIDAPGGMPIMIMAQWDSATLIAERWVRIFHNGGQLVQQDQRDTFQAYAPAISQNSSNIIRLEFQRPSGGVMNTTGVLNVICPIR